MFPRPSSSMRVPIIMPQLGESIAEATVVSIAVAVGEHVAADQEIIEVETNKALVAGHDTLRGRDCSNCLSSRRKLTRSATILGYVQAAPEEVERLGLQPTDCGRAQRADARRGTRAARTQRQRQRPARGTPPCSAPGRRNLATERRGRDPAMSPPTLAHGGAGGGLPVPARVGRRGLPVAPDQGAGSGTGPAGRRSRRGRRHRRGWPRHGG